MTRPVTTPPVTSAKGSVGRAEHLPAGFTDRFTSHLVFAGEVTLHAVVGGNGPPLLLVPGWPQNWYTWREMMPALAEKFTVVAVDPRGVGLSEQARSGYDTGTLAADLVGLMGALGYGRFAVVGHDVGMWTGYALAADHPGKVERLVVAEAAIPGLGESPPLLGPERVNDRLWHFGFNRLRELNEQLVTGREAVFFGGQFRSKAATPTSVPDYAVDYYIDLLAGHPEALRCSFEPYRALDETIAQNQRRRGGRLALPVMAVAGSAGSGALAGEAMSLVADDLTSVVLPDCGHYPAEEVPGAFLQAIEPFLAPWAERVR
ncbi:MAG TPA: alpha/beta hydrolase [Trebonia sp.]